MILLPIRNPWKICLFLSLSIHIVVFVFIFISISGRGFRDAPVFFVELREGLATLGKNDLSSRPASAAKTGIGRAAEITYKETMPVKETPPALVKEEKNEEPAMSSLLPLPIGRGEGAEGLVGAEQKATPGGGGNLTEGGGKKNTADTGGGALVETRFGALEAPRFIHREMPEYPLLARRLGKEGKVVLALIINEQGKLEKVEVVEGADYGFTEAAVWAVKKSHFSPAKKDGKAVSSRALLTVRFKLD